MKKILLFCLLLPTLAFADATSNLTDLLGKANTLQANFQQKILNSTGFALQDSSGVMMIKRPGKFLWQINQPNKQKVIVNGNKVTVYDIDLEQITIRKLQQNDQGVSPAALLSGSLNSLSKQFNVTETKGQGQLVSFKLTAKQKNSLFKWVMIAFDGRTLKSMTVADDLGQKTVFAFNRVKTNLTLPNSLFILKAPKDVDVVNDYG